MTDNARKTGAAVEAHFQFLMWLVPAIEKFPRTQKFLLGDRIQTTSLDVLECLIEGYLLSLITQVVVFPIFQIEVSLADNMAISVIFTVVSLVRSYVLRRVFERVQPV